ncbi:TPA: hypothetical protein QHR04_004537 [Enterobacter kobei]|nr:hypothetical protein [Enterobacter kobei]
MSVKPTYEELERYGRQADITIENLEQKLAVSQREFRAADATIENLQMQVEKLAAENAGLNEKMNKLATWPGIEFYSSAWEFNNSDGNAALEYMCDTETPATDAFLAEVRAQGVEMFAAVLRRKGDDAFFDAIAEAQANAADQFAAQIRKGVQS